MPPGAGITSELSRCLSVSLRERHSARIKQPGPFGLVFLLSPDIECLMLRIFTLGLLRSSGVVLELRTKVLSPH